MGYYFCLFGHWQVLLFVVLEIESRFSHMVGKLDPRPTCGIVLFISIKAPFSYSSRAAKVSDCFKHYFPENCRMFRFAGIFRNF